ncbi:MAG: hypothetical protein EZS28_055925, partial [Streblomastix strix]
MQQYTSNIGDRSQPQPPPPSKVLHIRTASNYEKEVDLNYILPFLSNFGQVVYVVTMPRIKQALAEMDSIENAQKAFDYTGGNIV